MISIIISIIIIIIITSIVYFYYIRNIYTDDNNSLKEIFLFGSYKNLDDFYKDIELEELDFSIANSDIVIEFAAKGANWEKSGIILDKGSITYVIPYNIHTNPSIKSVIDFSQFRKDYYGIIPAPLKQNAPIIVYGIKPDKNSDISKKYNIIPFNKSQWSYYDDY